MTVLLRTCCLFFSLLLVPDPLWAVWQTASIGILTKERVADSFQKWSATADYLTDRVPGTIFTIVPLGFTEIHDAVAQGRVDFILTNPAMYVELEKFYGVNRIATLVNQDIPGLQTTTYGSVIFTRADRADINTLADLRGKSFMAVDALSFGGWIAAWREFFRQNVNPSTDFSLLVHGGTHDKVVMEVLAGSVDAGCVRTDTLERLVRSGKIQPAQFKVLNAKPKGDFPYLLSTDLYPEWPMAALKTTPERLARLVASALLSMNCDDPAAVCSQTAGWTIPLTYQRVHECLLELKIGPYQDYGQFSHMDVLSRYWRHLSILALAVALVVAAAWYALLVNRILRRKKQEVDRLNITLDTKVHQRTEKITALLDQQIYLKGILQTVADINKLLITSPNIEVLLKEACELFVQHGHYGFAWIGLLEDGKIYKTYCPEYFDKYLAPPPYTINDPAIPFYNSPTARCIREDAPVISDRDHEQDYTPWWNQVEIKGFQAAIALPLRARQTSKALGSLAIYTWLKEGFEPEEIDMLVELSGDIGFAIDSFRHREEITRLNLERTANYQETIFTFVNMIEQRDTYTAGHTERVARYCQKIARAMELPSHDIERLYKAAILHDIGKIATPDSVLLKPGKLDAIDYDLIKLHATVGYEILSSIEMYKDLAEIIRHHHERHDGKGYPDGLAGNEIPFLTRIMTVADAFDAMTTNRIYKPRKQIDEALAELTALAGSQFNPEVVAAAVKVLEKTNPPVSVTQAPITEIEKKRFSYFFNDRLTGLYNEDYLRIFLQNNENLHEYTCLHILHLTHLLEYNREKGWEQGNRIFRDFAAELQARYPDALLFRAYGNDFAILTRVHFDLEPATFHSFTSLAGLEISIELQHIDLEQDKSYTLNKSDKLLISTPDNNNRAVAGATTS